MRAALKGELDMARQILGAGGRIEALNADGNNALWLACVEKHLAMIDLLIEAGIDIDNRNDNGATALMYAASSGRTDVVAHLLARGADISPETLDGFSAMDMAGNVDCLGLLRAAHKKARLFVEPGQSCGYSNSALGNDDQPFDQVAALEVALDDIVDVLCRLRRIPHALRIDHHQRPRAAKAETTGGSEADCRQGARLQDVAPADPTAAARPVRRRSRADGPRDAG